MSRFLKFIVHLVVICLILIVLGLAVPGFFGVTTQIQDDASSRTNLPLGSVVYAVPVSSGEMKVGDPILVTEGDTVYRYVVAGVDLPNGRATVVDAGVANAEPVKVAVGQYYPRIALQVPLIGYLLMATQSTTGMIILGLVILFLVILFIISELWKKGPDTEEEYYQDQEAYQPPAEQPDEARPEPVRPRRKSDSGKIRTGGFLDEVDESDFEDEDEESFPEEEYPEEQVYSATSEAHEVLKQGIAATTAQQLPVPEEDGGESRPQVSRQRRSAKPSKGANARRRAFQVQPEAEKEEHKEIKKLAIPRYSASQLARSAKLAGDNPEVIRDEITDVTMFDYSDIFTEAQNTLDEEGDF